MRIALLSDIHANREAFEAVLGTVLEADRIVILGDIVGYGADPGWCVETVRSLLERGARVVRGNHDQAACDAQSNMTTSARTAIAWTREQLSPSQKDFLSSLPVSEVEEDRLYVHSEGSAPSRWHYVTDVDDAEAHFAATRARISFCGHTHQPALYCKPPQGRITRFVPNSATGVPLLQQRRWLAVMGSVGQPRDGNPQAAFGLYDTSRRELSYRRIAYDVDTAQQKIRAAGLPDMLATRLARGH